MSRTLRAAPWIACVALVACGGAGTNTNTNTDPSGMTPTLAGPQRGQLLSNSEVGTYAASDLLPMLGGSTLGKELLQLAYTPICLVNVYHIEYETVGGQGEAATATGALMVPSGVNSACTGARPIVLYAHGTSTDRNYNIANFAT